MKKTRKSVDETLKRQMAVLQVLEQGVKGQVYNVQTKDIQKKKEKLVKAIEKENLK